MTTFNKILINCIENDIISKDDYYKILTLLSEIKNNEIKLKKLRQEEKYLNNELIFLKSKYTLSQNSAQKEINSSLNRLYNIEEIELFQKSLNAKKEIFKTIKKYQLPQRIKSSVKKYLNHLEYLTNKKEKLEQEIQKNQDDLRILKNRFHKKQTLEHYNNNLIRFELPKMKKEILKQEFYIELFTKNKGR